MIQIFLALCTAFSLPTSLRLIKVSGSEWGTIVLEHRITDFIDEIADILVDGTNILVNTDHGMTMTLENGDFRRILRQLEIMEGDIQGQIVFSQKQHDPRHSDDEADLKESFEELEYIFETTEGLEDYLTRITSTYGDGLMTGFPREISSKEEAADFMREKLIDIMTYGTYRNGGSKALLKRSRDF